MRPKVNKLSITVHNLSNTGGVSLVYLRKFVSLFKNLREVM